MRQKISCSDYDRSRTKALVVNVSKRSCNVNSARLQSVLKQSCAKIEKGILTRLPISCAKSIELHTLCYFFVFFFSKICLYNAQLIILQLHVTDWNQNQYCQLPYFNFRKKNVTVQYMCNFFYRMQSRVTKTFFIHT